MENEKDKEVQEKESEINEIFNNLHWNTLFLDDQPSDFMRFMPLLGVVLSLISTVILVILMFRK